MGNNAFLDYCQLVLWPSAVAAWYRLDVPSWDVYHPVLQQCFSDIWKASQSTAQLSYLTFRPIAILFLMLTEGLWEIAKVLFRVLLSQGWVHIKKGIIQLKVAVIWFYHFQMSLSHMELLGEAVLIGSLVGLYYAYKWIRRQTYWQRFTRWYSEKKQRAIEKTTKFIDRVARVSLILAMAVPHTVFLGGYIALKVIFPSFVKWLAYDTYTTALISIWYPLIMTLSWVHDKKQSKYADSSAAKTTNESLPSRPRIDKPSNEMKDPSSEPHNNRRPAYMRTTASQKSREHTTNKRYTGSFPRTSPPKPETPQRQLKEQALTKTPSQKEGFPRPMSPTLNFLLNNEHEAATRYWLRYWVVYALIQSVGTLATMVPVFGNFVAQHPYVLHICCELKLLFFIWLFSMEKLIGSVVVQEEALMAKAMPLNLIHDYITPLLLEFEAVVAESVSEKTWTSLVHSKAQRVLEVFVMLKMISDDRKDWLLHFLDEGRTLLLPSLCLFMPSFITRFGVAYVQFIVPSAKSTRALDGAKKRSKQGHVEIEGFVLLHLQYWIIHCLGSGFLGYFSTLLWWIPFSTHATFLVWCHLSFPKSITQSYEVLEAELVAFGLLPGKTELQIHETRTAQILHAVYSRLPSATESDKKDAEELEPRTGSVEEEKKASKHDSTYEPETSHPHLDRSISVDSQQTNVEVSIRDTTQLCQTETIPRKQTPARNDDDDDESMPAIKPSESSTTAETCSTRITHDVASIDSASTTSSSASKDEPKNLRRSTRQRRRVT